MYVKLVSMPTDKAASPDVFFVRADFEQEKAKVAINVLVYGKYRVQTLTLRPAKLTKFSSSPSIKFRRVNQVRTQVIPSTLFKVIMR
jgi:hypothetical protein